MRSAMPSAHARRLCPGLLIIPPAAAVIGGGFTPDAAQALAQQGVVADPVPLARLRQLGIAPSSHWFEPAPDAEMLTRQLRNLAAAMRRHGRNRDAVEIMALSRRSLRSGRVCPTGMKSSRTAITSSVLSRRFLSMAPGRSLLSRRVSVATGTGSTDLTSILRSCKRSLTLRSDSGNQTYIITARPIISREVLK